MLRLAQQLRLKGCLKERARIIKPSADSSEGEDEDYDPVTKSRVPELLDQFRLTTETELKSERRITREHKGQLQEEQRRQKGTPEPRQYNCDYVCYDQYDPQEPMLKSPIIERPRARKASKKQQLEQEQPEITKTPTD